MKRRAIPIMVLLVLVGSWSLAQGEGIIQQLQEEEKGAIEAIALYPKEERTAILVAATRPEILVRMAYLRSYAETAFKDRVSGMTEDEQKRVYNIFRYPDLVRTITEADRSRTQEEIEFLLRDYPEEIREDAFSLNRHHFGTLKALVELYDESEEAFDRLLLRYPDEVRRSYQILAGLPEVVGIMNANMTMTVLLGDIYTNDPGSLLEELDSLNVVVAEARAAELENWKEDLEEDPEAMHEYEQAANEFAREHGYDDEPYSGPIPDRYRENVYVNYIWRPYPYWFGWPTWYGYECWYPYPWWYHWGYYYGPGNVITVVGLPSRVFLHWQLYNYRHLHYYPHFTNRIIHHAHYGSRRTGSSITNVVRNWEERHREELPARWFDEDGARAERIKEYGTFKMDHASTVRRAVDKAPSEKKFLRENADRYPSLKPVLDEKPEPRKAISEEEEKRVEKPEIAPEPYQPRDKVIERYRTNKEEEVDRAKEQHENIWDRIRKTPTRDNPPEKVIPRKSEPKVTPRPAKPRKDVRPSAPRKADPVKKKAPLKRSPPGG